MLKSKFSAILVDLDGLLVDTETLGQRVMSEIWQEAGYRRLDAAELALYLGRPDREVFHELGRRRRLDLAKVDRLHHAYRRRYLDQLRSHPLEPLPGVCQGLRLLNGGHRLALVTGSTRVQAESVLDRLSLVEVQWSEIITADEVVHGKPSPEPFIEAAERLRVPIHHCVVVEDSMPGVLAARSAGASVLHVGPFHPRTSLLADRHIDRLDRIDDVLLEEVWRHRPLPPSIDIASLGELGVRLVETGLARELGAAFAGPVDLWEAFQNLTQTPPSKLDSLAQPLWSLWVAGLRVQAEELRSALGGSLLSRLIDCELIEAEQDEFWSRLRLMSLDGEILFKEPPRLPANGRPLSCDTYLETCSLTFTRTVIDVVERRAFPPRKVLDVGAGTGLAIFRVLAECPRARGTGIDLDARAVHLARANAALNRLDDRVDFRQGDLFAPLTEDENFDLILCHPPYRLMPAEVPYPDPLSRPGTGKDGLGIVIRFLAGLAGHLAPDGEGLLLLELPHDERRPEHFENELRQAAPELQLDFQQVGPWIPVAEIARIGADKCLLGRSVEHETRLLAAYSAIGADHLRPVLLRVYRG